MEVMKLTTTEAIRARRSIRKFKPEAQIPQEQIDMLMEAAMMAPSAINTRPWEFVVVKNKDKFNEIIQVHPYSRMLLTASLCIVVCGLPDEQSGLSAGFYPQDCAAATQNILLQATDLGLGTCWCGVYPIKERVEGLRKVLKVTSVPFNLIAVGVPDEVCRPRGFFDPGKVKYL
ncbi:nitroreductase family protein [Sporomusa rhizae]|uniref:nitroreductase family protein n=1 Tax=Sporomusa rhizae TaxID=357999 RepID=UPI00352B222B